MASRGSTLLLAATIGVGCKMSTPSAPSPSVAPTGDTAPVVDTGPFDADFDGWPASQDCDDTRAGVNPGVVIDGRHLCKGIDHDCDGLLDGEEDHDQDGQSYCDFDCDDANPERFRGAADPIDGTDQNCDGTDGVGETPHLMLEGTTHASNAGTVLRGGDIDGDGCSDLLISDASLTTQTNFTGSGGTGGLNKIHVLRGCQEPQAPLLTYSEQVSDGIGAILETFGSGTSTRVLSVGWYNPGESGIARVIDFTVDPPMLETSFQGDDPGDMHAAAILRSGSDESALFQSYNNNGSGPGGAWSIPFSEPVVFDTPETLFWAEMPGSGFAYNLVPFDRDGDGTDELVTYGRETQTSVAGTVYVLAGPTIDQDPLETWTGDTSIGSAFGSRLYPAPGVPDAGVRSLLAGGVNYLEGGALYVLPPLGDGAHDITQAPHVFKGEFPSEWFGFSAAVGDVTGDGVADVVVGAPQVADVDERSGEPGKVYVYEGPFDAPVLERQNARVFVGTQPGALFGWSIALADLNMDGTNEIYVGQPKTNLVEPPTHGDQIGVGAVYRLDL